MVDLHVLSLEQLVAKEKVLKEAERRAAKEAGPNRSHFLNGLAEAKAKEGNTTAAKALTRLILQEEQRTSHRRVKAVNGKLRGSKPLVLQKRSVTSGGHEVSIDLNSKEEQEKEALEHFAERCQGTIMVEAAKIRWIEKKVEEMENKFDPRGAWKAMREISSKL